MFSDDFATLTHYKDSLNKRVSDYVIRFHSEQNDVEMVVKQTFDVVKQLVKHYHDQDKTITGRIVAMVNYFHTEKKEMVTYYHPSFQAEVIDRASDFYFAHMLRICERMDNFHHHGSNLMIHNIEEIHLHISLLD